VGVGMLKDLSVDMNIGFEVESQEYQNTFGDITNESVNPELPEVGEDLQCIRMKHGIDICFRRHFITVK
jgi:hypothetical protein